MAAVDIPALITSFYSAHPYARYAIVAITGATTLSMMPGIILHSLELFVYFRAHPLRSIIEFAGSSTLLGSVAMDLLGFKLPIFLNRLLEPYIPAAWSGLQPTQRFLLRLAVGSLFYLSFSRGANPAPRKKQLNMTNKTAVVTGGTSGVGFETAKALAQCGAKVLIIARNRDKGLQYADTIKKQTSNENIVVLVADQEDLKAIASLDATIREHAPNGIDVVLLNAGAAPSPQMSLGPSGYERSICSMHLAHHLLMKMMWPQLNPKARIIVTSSAANAACPTVDEIFQNVSDLKVPEGALVPSGTGLYARAKLANALLARQLGRLADQDSRGIIVTSHHPGAVATSIWAGIEPRIIGALMDFVSSFTMRDTYTGAATLIDAAVGEEPLIGQDTAPNGSFYISSRRIVAKFLCNPLLENPTAGAEFWSRTEQYIHPFEPAGATWNTK